jgi:hypothetical protein
VADEREQGWYTDQCGRHETRWMSHGFPTRLVRDGEAGAFGATRGARIALHILQDED